MQIKIVNHSKHPLPQYDTSGSAGMDLRANLDSPITLASLERTLIPTGLFIAFIDFDRFNKTNKEHFKKAIAPNGEKILMHVSNFRPVKRVEDVIKMFAKVHEAIPSKLILIGDGPEKGSQPSSFAAR